MIGDNQKSIKKLEQQIKQLEDEITLQAKQQDVIKDYKMKEGDYQIIIKIYQANDLEPRESKLWLLSKTACDAFVEIQIRDKSQKTIVKKETNNPIFDERFCFKFDKITLEQLDRSTINFKVYDRKNFIERHSLIGSFELDWTNVYFKRNHEIYRGWLTLMDPFDDCNGITGYLLVDIAVLGENDKVTVHDSAFIKDPLTTIQDTVTMPKLQLIDYAINIQLFRAQNLIPLDQASGNVDAYVIAKFSGNKIDSSVKHSSNPQWDELLQIGTAVPTKSKYIILEVRNRNYLTKDDIIGIIKIPFIDLQQESKPRWGHLYGPPMSGKDIKPYNFATKMQLYGQKIGSHYRGRILYQITGKKDSVVKNSRKKINFKFPFKPTPVIPLKTYTMRIDLLNGFDLPEVKDKCFIHACIGQYTLCSRQFEKPKNNCIQFMQRMDEKKINLPEDISQIPDLIIYFACGKRQRDRVSYVRIKAEEVFNSKRTDKNLLIYSLTGDLSLKNIGLNENGGYLTLRAFLFSGLAPETLTMRDQLGKKKKFIVKSFIYRGKGFPPMNESGDCDALIEVKCQGQSVNTRSVSSYNPVWNELKQFEIETYDILNVNLQLGLICTAFDDDRKKRNMIGNFMVKLKKADKRKFKGRKNKIQLIYGKPLWYPVCNQKVDVGDPCYGHVLYACCVFRRQDSLQIESQKLSLSIEKYEKKLVQLYLIGIRQLQSKEEYLSSEKISLKIKVGEYENNESFKSNLVKEGSVHYNKMVNFDIKLPKNRCLVPYIDFRLQRDNKFYAYSSINLYEAIPKIKQIQKQEEKKNKVEDQEGQIDSSQSQETILDVENLQKQLNIVRKRQKIRQARLNAIKHKQGYLNTELTKLVPPSQLGGNVSTEDSQKHAKLTQLLDIALKQYNENSEYNYARKLELEKDEESLHRSESSISQNRKEINQLNQRIKQQQKRLRQKEKAQEQRKKKIKIEQQLEFNESRKQIVVGKKKSGFERKDIENEDMRNYKSKNNFENKQEADMQNLRLLQHIASNNMIDREQEQFNKQIKYNNDQKSVRDSVNDLKARFLLGDEKQSIMQENGKVWEQKTMTNFQIDDNQQISQVWHDNRMITYNDVARIIQQQQNDTKQALQRMENYKYAAAVKLSLFNYKKQKEDPDKQTYQDYNTDIQEDLDIIPEWYKGRKILSTDFEDLVQQKKKIKSLNLYRGGQTIGNLDIRKKEKIGHIRFVAISTSEAIADEKQKYYQKLLKVKSFVCRIYVLKGKSLISNYRGKPSTFLRISSRGQQFDLKDRTYKKEDYNPEYYICQQIPMDIPGPSTVKIQVMEQYGIKGSIRPKVLGYTIIDLEERHFMKKWHLFTQKKPIELRNLYSEYGIGTQGRLQVWIDLIEKKNWLNNPPYKIHPPPYDPFELRVIVWSTKDCVYKNQALKSNDIYVRGYLGVSDPQQTDTHWACRGLGNFNYRFKFKTNYPPKPQQMYSDQFIVQIWDRDLVGYNNLIGERRINLNKIHRIIEKAVKRKKAVKAKMKIRQKSLALTEKFWFDVYNHKAKNQFGQLESQGKVQLSFELVPTHIAQQQMKNGFGRSDPNVFPTLQQPSGRLNFSLLHPLDFCKQLCGPELYKSICSKIVILFILILVGVLAYFIIGQLTATAIVGGGAA